MLTRKVSLQWATEVRSRRKRLAVVLMLLVVAGGTVASWPSHRKIGVNKIVTEHTLPLWIKTVDFVDRDLNLARTAAAVLRPFEGDEARAMSALEWTAEHVRPQPLELPVVDDHVWYVIVRGYGEPDQQADVFTTLLVYEDVPAYWMLIGTPPDELALSYVLIGGRWRVFDVAHGIVFRTRTEHLATPDNLVADPTLVSTAAQGRVADLGRYVGYFRAYRAPQPPEVFRAQMQMPGRRALHELRRLVGREGRVWQIR